LEEKMMADNLPSDRIDFQNVRFSRSRPRLVAASAAEADMMIVVVVVDDGIRAGPVFRQKRAE
jgi:hypothetical protein